MSERKNRDWTLLWIVIFWLASMFWSAFIVWQANDSDQRQRESECRLISGTWAAERGMCFVPNTTLNGLNP